MQNTEVGNLGLFATVRLHQCWMNVHQCRTSPDGGRAFFHAPATADSPVCETADHALASVDIDARFFNIVPKGKLRITSILRPRCFAQVGRRPAGQRPSNLPSPGQWPGNRGNGLSGGLRARPFAPVAATPSAEIRQMTGPLALYRPYTSVYHYYYPGRWPGLGKRAGPWP